MNTPPQPWNAVDWLLAAAMLFSTLSGMLRGLIRTLFGLAGLFCGFAVAAWQYRNAGEWVRFHGWVSSPAVADIVSYVAISIAVMILFGISGSAVRRTAEGMGLGFLDRLVGGAVGALRGILIGTAVVLGIHALLPHSEALRTSQLSSCFLAAAHTLSFVVPHSLR